MKIGKLPEPVLVRSVIKQVKHRRKEILTGPAVGVDCAALETSPGEVLVMSSDPITWRAWGRRGYYSALSCSRRNCHHL